MPSLRYVRSHSVATVFGETPSSAATEAIVAPALRRSATASSRGLRRRAARLLALGDGEFPGAQEAGGTPAELALDLGDPGAP
jgi:hypothetical protein